MKAVKDIPGWFDFADLYDQLIRLIPNDGAFVELGAWLGKSSAYLCDRAQLYENEVGNKVNAYIVDHWQGSADELETTQRLATERDIYQMFLANMGRRDFTAMRMDTAEASKQFADQSVDVVFVDAQHTYEAVHRDLTHWLPKVKKGGVIAGHDYYLDGVRRAVHEVLKHPISMWGSCWVHPVGTKEKP